MKSNPRDFDVDKNCLCKCCPYVFNVASAEQMVFGFAYKLANGTFFFTLSSCAIFQYLKYSPA